MFSMPSPSGRWRRSEFAASKLPATGINLVEGVFPGEAIKSIPTKTVGRIGSGELAAKQ
jgi:hypothetical protein